MAGSLEEPRIFYTGMGANASGMHSILEFMRIVYEYSENENAHLASLEELVDEFGGLICYYDD